MSGPPTRILGLLRVSSRKQAEGVSLAEQRRIISEYAWKRFRLPVAHYFVAVEGASADKTARRDGVRALLRELKTGDLVLCDKVDRWTRDGEFGAQSLAQIAAAGGNIYFISEACDPSTAEGRSIFDRAVAYAQFEHERIRIRTVGARKALRDEGFHVEGPLPYGLHRSPVRSGAGKPLGADDDAVRELTNMFVRCVDGGSVRAIGREFGLKHDRVARVLRHIAYNGQVRDSRGQIITGQHPAFVDPALFARAQAALDSRRRGPRRRKDGQ